jgi:hypothetical protein
MIYKIRAINKRYPVVARHVSALKEQTNKNKMALVISKANNKIKMIGPEFTLNDHKA